MTYGFSLDRRSLLGGLAGSFAPVDALAKQISLKTSRLFPEDFLWGASVSGHQTEGNNSNSDIWLLENVTPTLYRERSGDALNSLHLWRNDIDMARGLGLTSYRFSLEWARIEPEPGQFSVAMLDHYRRILDHCIASGMTPVVTFNHFSAPRWFGARNGWLDEDAASLFARFCDKAARHLADRLKYVVTINEPNIEHSLKWANLPPELQALRLAMRQAAAKACGTKDFSAFTSIRLAELDRFRDMLCAGHRAGRDAIRAAQSGLRTGMSLAVSDDQAVGSPEMRDTKRREVYEPFFAATAGDDFVGVQNYERSRLDMNGPLPVPKGANLNQMGGEIYPQSLGNSVQYVHAATNLPILVTEHGVATENDQIRSSFIVKSMKGLMRAMEGGVPVLGYMHWSLFDNFEWIFGYGPQLGLVSVERKTFVRTPKPSASVYSRLIASASKLSRNGVIRRSNQALILAQLIQANDRFCVRKLAM